MSKFTILQRLSIEVVGVSCLNRVMLTSESWFLQNEMKLWTLR